MPAWIYGEARNEKRETEVVDDQVLGAAVGGAGVAGSPESILRMLLKQEATWSTRPMRRQTACVVR